MHCEQCGALLEAEARFCAQCGASREARCVDAHRSIRRDRCGGSEPADRHTRHGTSRRRAWRLVYDGCVLSASGRYDALRARRRSWESRLRGGTHVYDVFDQYRDRDRLHLANWKIAVKAGYQGVLSLLLLIPMVNLVIYLKEGKHVL